MKYIIIGGGPTGLSLAYVLSKNNKEVVLIEKDKQLGGSWNSQWIDELYFSENSPRVFSDNGNVKQLFKELNHTDKDFANIYGNFFETNLKFAKFIFDHFNVLDYFIFLEASIKYKFINDNITLQDWMNKSNLSDGGKKAIKTLSIVICDRPDNTNINDFFGTVNLAQFKQLREPNKWHQIIEKELLKNNIVLKNNTVKQILEENNKIIGITLEENDTKNQKIIYGDKVFLCTQSNGIYNILKNSNYKIKNNWNSFKFIEKWSKNTFYSGFGFQLHFSETIKFPNQWCWSCLGDWSVIILPVSNWLKTISKDKKVKTVWSCCIVDMDSISKRINKTANECSKDEVLHECLYQISNSKMIPEPYKITTSEGLKKINNKWLSKNTGFTRKTLGDLPIKGKINNLFALGCFSKKDNPSIAYMGTAVDATVKYLNTFEPTLQGFHKNKNNNYKLKIIVLLIFFSILYYKR